MVIRTRVRPTSRPRRRFRRIRRAKKAPTAKTVNRRVDRLAMCIENKYILQSNKLMSNLQTAPQTLLLNGCQRGDTVQTRDGDKIIGKSIVIKGTIIQNLSAAPYASCIRLMIIGVKKNNRSTSINFSAASPALGYLFTNDNTNGPYTYQMYNFNNTEIKNNFKVFYDKVFCISQQTANIASFRPFYAKVPLSNKCSSYKGGNAGTGADIDEWSYWFVSFSDIDSAQTGCNIRYDVCFYFQDM